MAGVAVAVAVCLQETFAAGAHTQGRHCNDKWPQGGVQG